MGTSGQCFRKTTWQNLSCSQNATVSNPPVRSSPSENPPMPLKRSRTVKFFFLFSHPPPRNDPCPKRHPFLSPDPPRHPHAGPFLHHAIELCALRDCSRVTLATRRHFFALRKGPAQTLRGPGELRCSRETKQTPAHFAETASPCLAGNKGPTPDRAPGFDRTGKSTGQILFIDTPLSLIAAGIAPVRYKSVATGLVSPQECRRRPARDFYRET